MTRKIGIGIRYREGSQQPVEVKWGGYHQLDLTEAEAKALAVALTDFVESSLDTDEDAKEGAA